MKRGIIFIVFSFFFLIPLFNKSQAACQSVTVTKTTTQTGNEVYTAVATGCDQNDNRYFIEFAQDPGNPATTYSAGILPPPNASGEIRFTFSNFLTLEDVQRVTGGVIPAQMEFIFRVFDTQGFDQTDVETRFTVTDFGDATCGDRIPDTYNGCPQECPLTPPQTGNNNTNFYMCAYPVQTPPLSCRVDVVAQISSSSEYFVQATVTGIEGLRSRPGNFRVCINQGSGGQCNGGWNPQDTSTGGWQVTFQPTGASLGSSYTVFVEPECLWWAGACNPVCQATATFLATTPTLAPRTTPFLEVSPTLLVPRPTPYCTDVLNEQCINGCIPTEGGGMCRTPGGPRPTGSGSGGSPFAFDGFCDDGRPGVQTAIGCFPIAREKSNLNNLIGIFISFAIGIAGGIAFLLIIFGGLRIIMSSGNPEAMNEGKEIVSSAITGLLLIVFSVFILRFIGVNILQIPGFF